MQSPATSSKYKEKGAKAGQTHQAPNAMNHFELQVVVVVVVVNPRESSFVIIRLAHLHAKDQ